MNRRGPIGSGQHFSNGFGTSSGLVVYYLVVAWDWVHEKRGIIQPLADDARAAWAVRVLGNQYPGRTYETVKKYAPEGVTIEQMEFFEAPVVEDLSKLEIAHNLGLDWYE
ncbi:hypothetical protein R4K01_12920 [Pseudomonas aeruginosa]|uniref:hypothetical protein n=1 Tax=Pseudomonas aeruginosa TaxID=287 RepID=UPI00053D84EE|nr:hypothetical protein [Pseudomonas aeruginosa]MBG4707721.1 hypothetical protein [Pseudomonas aeruginosa]MBG5227055.1 hypothetical protein [Pseudomonas aeruginosa]MBG6503330.1 hypothetical protein [Pseudomonas aeruginosa]MBH8769393.1 hypothetical protein [Pseudomonas aeruginosa]MBH9130813.1 hypothetical protein [Pseudomonas aeruginosa]